MEILAAQVKGPTESGTLELDGAGLVGQEIGKEGRGSALDDKTARLGEELGRLVIDENGSVYIGNQFWAAFRDEVCTPGLPAEFSCPANMPRPWLYSH